MDKIAELKDKLAQKEQEVNYYKRLSENVSNDNLRELEQLSELASQLKQKIEFIKSQQRELESLNNQLSDEIEEHSRSRNALLNTNKALTMTLDSVPADIYISDIDSHEILFMNAQMISSFDGNYVGSTCWKVFRDSNGPCAHCTNPKLVNRIGEEYDAIIWEGQNPVNNKWYLNCDRAIRWIDGRTVRLQVAMDVSELKKAEKEKAKYQHILKKSQRLESLGILAGGIAHDFNNILMGVSGSLALAKLYLSPKDKAHGHLEGMERALKRATALTGHFLTFATGGAPIKKSINIKDIVRETTEFNLAGSNIQTHYNIVGTLWRVSADTDQMSQVFSHLVFNARQAMPERGDLYISINNVEMTSGNPALLPPGKYVTIVMEDTGVGIPAEHIEKVFDPYFSTKQENRGLGLSIVHSIIDKHNGRIDITSELDKGTTVTICLPATFAKEANHVTSDRKNSPEKSILANVLLMDDEEFVLDITTEILEFIGCTVTQARDGAQAVEKFKESYEKEEHFDVIIMDLSIPAGMGGKEAVEKILEIDSKAKVIVASGYSSDPVMANYKKFGFKGMLSKPFTVSGLKDVLDEVLE